MKVPAGVGNLARLLEYRYDSTGRQVGLDVKMSTSVSITGTSASVRGDTTRFFYDASQNRTKLINKAGDVYQYVYDPTASFPAVVYEQGPEYRYLNVREPDGALVSREKYDGLGQRVANSIYHFDGLGNTRAISDGNGVMTDIYEYDAWGNLTSHDDPDEEDLIPLTTDNPYQYVGRYGYYTHYQEEDLDLLQLGVRYYDPGMGRFTQRDPVDIKKNSRYIYASDRPVMKTDPTGLWPTIVPGPSCKQISDINNVINEARELMYEYMTDQNAASAQLETCNATVPLQCWKGHVNCKKGRCGYAPSGVNFIQVSFDSRCPSAKCLIVHELVHRCGLKNHKPDDWSRVEIPECGGLLSDLGTGPGTDCPKK